MAAKAKRKAKARRAPAKRKTKPRTQRKYWSAGVMHRSDALDLKSRVFTWRDPKRIARSLKQSAEHSSRRKAGPYQSAMSMLNFYLNRGGRNLPADRKRVLTRAKTELRRLFGRE
jgi:hypothetical protein